jgi:hypothetical protein
MSRVRPRHAHRQCERSCAEQGAAVHDRFTWRRNQQAMISNPRSRVL